MKKTNAKESAGQLQVDWSKIIDVARHSPRLLMLLTLLLSACSGLTPPEVKAREKAQKVTAL